jgi:sulfoxide reductase heme-binding subunit YedZ
VWGGGKMVGMPARAVPYLKVLVHLLCLVPFLGLVYMYKTGALANEPDPVNFLTHATGKWALWILLADLAITPVRRLSSALAWLIRFRRMVGLYAFFYATLHLMIYVFLFSGYDVPTAIAGLRAGHLGEPFHQFGLVWPTMLGDLLKRRFIQVGLFAWLILLALAVTSPQRVLRAMGGKNWQRLHRLIYVAAAAACIHFWWMVKTGVLRPWKDTAVLTVLLLSRLVYWLWKRRAVTVGTPAAGV